MVLYDENGKEVGVVGDRTWDLSVKFVEKFMDIYYQEFGKIATLQEIISSIEFVYDGKLEKLLQEQYECDSQSEEE